MPITPPTSADIWKPMVDPAFVARAREHTLEHVMPHADAIDQDDVYPLEIIRGLASAGLTKTILPTEYGGAGNFELTAALFEEISYASCAAAVSLISIFQAMTMMRLFGTRALQDTYMPRIADGMACAYSLTEANHGSDIRSLDTKAVRDGDEWVLNGEKSFITSGSKAEFVVTLAETPVGVSVFAVPYPLPGLEKYVGEHSSTFGLRNGPHVNMRLKDVRLPADHLIGTEGKGVRQAVTTLDYSRNCAAAISIGIARAAFDGALERARGRVAFDNTILSLQGIQWYFADMLTEIDAARLAVYRAGRSLNDHEDIDRYSSVAKLKAGQVATQVCLTAMQICGAWGTSDNTPFGRFLRDAKTYEIGGGSNEILKNTIGKYLVRGTSA
jgi:alkylation response protein AidB-like acyl-CoA dehydrogenase